MDFKGRVLCPSLFNLPCSVQRNHCCKKYFIYLRILYRFRLYVWSSFIVFGEPDRIESNNNILLYIKILYKNILIFLLRCWNWKIERIPVSFLSSIVGVFYVSYLLNIYLFILRLSVIKPLYFYTFNTLLNLKIRFILLIEV